MKTIYYRPNDVMEIFFDDKFNLLDYWSKDDGVYNPTSMDGFLKKLDINVVHISNKYDNHIMEDITKELMKNWI